MIEEVEDKIVDILHFAERCGVAIYSITIDQESFDILGKSSVNGPARVVEIIRDTLGE